jgi:hypothetical protein
MKGSHKGKVGIRINVEERKLKVLRIKKKHHKI